MIKKTMIFTLFVVIVLGYSNTAVVFAQRKAQIKVIGKIVAYNRLWSLVNITAAPQLQTFIIKIDKVIKGKESQSFIIVQYKGFGINNSKLNQLISDKNKLKLKLKREVNCDSSLEQLQNIKPEGKPQNQETLSRIEWISNDIAKPESKMPCYLLNDADITLIK